MEQSGNGPRVNLSQLHLITIGVMEIGAAGSHPSIIK